MIKREIDRFGNITYLRDRDYHKTNGPAVAHPRTKSWDWFLFDNWHRYYGPQNNKGNWFLYGERVK